MPKSPSGWMTISQTAALFRRSRGPKLLSLADRREIRRVLRDEIRKYERRGKGEQPAA
jgi:hypothetical protein